MHANMYIVKFLGCTIFALLLLSQNTTSEQTFCGPALYDILDGICLNGYQKMLLPTKKRSELPSLGLDIDESTTNDILPFVGNSIYMDKVYAGIVNAMAKTRRRRHGIYDECCRKGCTFAELSSYCSSIVTP